MFFTSFRNIFVGDFTMKRPTILVKNESLNLMCPNMFINLNFRMEQAEINVWPMEQTVLFWDCSFSSRAQATVSAEEDLIRMDLEEQDDLLDAFLAETEDTEDYEARDLEDADKERIQRRQWRANMRGNPSPTIVVFRGVCALINCTILESLGAGVLVLRDDNKVGPQESLLYMRGCLLSNCGFAAVECRKDGNLILEDCKIMDSAVGVFIWNFASSAILKRCEIFHIDSEGIHACSACVDDNQIKLVVEDCKVHHCQLGYSLEYVKSINVRNCQIFSNRSWGMAIRNTTLCYIGHNQIFKNHCGGIRASLIRDNQTVLLGNVIRDHTGPDILQNRFHSESYQESDQRFGLSGLREERNKIPVIVIDNVSYNNELAYGSINELRITIDKTCALCAAPGAGTKCPQCRTVFYCSKRCQVSHRDEHKEFCSFFKEKQTLNVKIDYLEFEPSNKTIGDFRGQKSRDDPAYKEEFIIKITHGKDNYGLTPARLPVSGPTSPELELILGELTGPDVLWLYDKYRNVSGVGRNEKLKQIVRQLGKTINNDAVAFLVVALSVSQ